MTMLAKLAAATALAFGAAATPALALGTAPHLVTVQLPGGGVVQIAYSGDQRPMLVLAPALADFGRMEAAMDRQMDAMLQQAAMLSRLPMAMPRMVPAAAPAGGGVVAVYEEITTNGACTQRTEITYGGGATPRQVSSESGTCGNALPQRRVFTPVGPATPKTPRLIEARATRPHTVRDALLRTADRQG